MTSSPSPSSSVAQHQQQHFPLGSQERFEEDKKLSQAKLKEIESKRNQQLKQQCTFKPATHAAPSTVLGMNNSSQHIHHQEDDDNTNEGNHSIISSHQQILASRAADVVSRLQQSDVNRRQRLEEALKVAEAKRYQGLTFKPEINPLSAKTATVKNLVLNNNNNQQQQQPSRSRSNPRKNNDQKQEVEGDEENDEENNNNNHQELTYMKVEDRLLREGRLAEARKTRMKMELARQELALQNMAMNHQVGGGDTTQQDHDAATSSKPLWKRLQESDKLAKENRERLRMYLENQFTFKPSINHVSAATVSLSRAAADQEEDSSSSHQGSSDENEDDSVVHRLYDESIKQRNERARERQEEEMKARSRQYTFAPQVSIRSAQLAVRRAASQGGGGGTFAQRQQHAEACRQEHLSVIKEAMRIKDEKEKMNSKFSGYGKHFDPSEMSDHVKRMSEAAQQRDLKLKELAERSRAAECPFQPVTTKRSADIVARKFSVTSANNSSSVDVVQRMEMERRAASAARKRHEEKNNNNTNNEHENNTSASTSTTNGVITASRLQDFLEAQDEHVRRKEEKVLLLRHQLATDEIAQCTFRPETNYDDTTSQYSSANHNNNNNNQHHVSSSSYRSSSAARSTSISTSGGNCVVDQKVKGMEGVRARVALAAKLKQEQAEREAKAWGTKNVKSSSSTNNNNNTSSNSIPRCAVASFDYPSSSSQQRQRRFTEYQQQQQQQQQQAHQNSNDNSTAVVNAVESKEVIEQQQQPQPIQSATTTSSSSVTLNKKRQQHQQQQQQEKPARHAEEDEDEDIEEIEYPQQQQQPQKQQQRLHHVSSSQIVKGAGLLPAHLLAEYESAWLQQQQNQQQQNQHSSNISSSSTPRMSLKKKPHNMHPEMQHVQYYSSYEDEEQGNGISPYRKKSAAYDLAIRKHLAADSVRLSSSSSKK